MNIVRLHFSMCTWSAPFLSRKSKPKLVYHKRKGKSQINLIKQARVHYQSGLNNIIYIQCD